jgi:hypothetical protein
MSTGTPAEVGLPNVRRRYELADFLGDFDFGFGRRAEREAVREHALHRFEHFGMHVAENHRAPGADVVDVAGAVRVPEVRALRANDKARRAADRAERPHRRIHAAGDGELGAFEQSLILGHGMKSASMRG